MVLCLSNYQAGRLLIVLRYDTAILVDSTREFHGTWNT